MIEFAAWPKTPRLFRDMIVTEKIDGTNAAVIVEPLTPAEALDEPLGRGVVIRDDDGSYYEVAAQSRKRLITPAEDNAGFARWTWDNAADLARILGPGRHFGEWWGSGIQRGYGLAKGEKRFSLFNVNRYAVLVENSGPSLDVVPTLYSGPFHTDTVRDVLGQLRMDGSIASPGFMRPEGVVVYHVAAGQVFKALLENDDAPKGEA